MIKAFNIWETEGIVVEDLGLRRYITLQPRIAPKTGAKYAGSRFHKSETFIVERLINKLMIPGHKGKKHYRSSGHCTGKAPKVYSAVQRALTIVENRTKINPIQVLVKAIENAAPREEIISIEYGGAVYPKAVECAPQRRVDISLRAFVQGTYNSCFGSKKNIDTALAEEIINAYNISAQSIAITKKRDMERQADSSR